MAAKVWIITTRPDRPVRDIAKELAKAGLSKGQVLEEIGVITGTAHEDSIPELRRVRGVVDVAPDLPIEVSS